MRTRRSGRRRGAAVVEMAVVLPVFLMLVLGTIEMARLGMVSQLVTTAAREGCRVAVLPGNDSSVVASRINAVLAGSGISPNYVISPLISASSPSGGTAVTVLVTVPYSSVAWLTPIQYLNGVTIQASATMSSERP